MVPLIWLIIFAFTTSFAKAIFFFLICLVTQTHSKSATTFFPLGEDIETLATESFEDALKFAEIDPSNITRVHTEGKRGLFGPKGKMDIYFGGSGEAAADGVPQGSADGQRRGFPDMSYDAS